MAVIVTGMDMPKSCLECPLTEKMSCFNFDFEDSEKRPKDCPLKSVEGLIESVENAMILMGIPQANRVDVMDRIVAYCGLEESNGISC